MRGFGTGKSESPTGPFILFDFIWFFSCPCCVAGHFSYSPWRCRLLFNWSCVCGTFSNFVDQSDSGHWLGWFVNELIGRWTVDQWRRSFRERCSRLEKSTRRVWEPRELVRKKKKFKSCLIFFPRINSSEFLVSDCVISRRGVPIGRPRNRRAAPPTSRSLSGPIIGMITCNLVRFFDLNWWASAGRFEVGNTTDMYLIIWWWSPSSSFSLFHSFRLAAIFWVSSLFSCCIAAPFLQVGGRAVSFHFLHFPLLRPFWQQIPVLPRPKHNNASPGFSFFFSFVFGLPPPRPKQTTDTSIVSSSENSYTTVSILLSPSDGIKEREELLFQRNNFFFPCQLEP